MHTVWTKEGRWKYSSLGALVDTEHDSPGAWLLHLGYCDRHHKLRIKRRGKYGLLSKKKMNWGVYRLAVYMRRRHREEFVAWSTKIRLGIK